MIRICDERLVEAVRQATCLQFRLNTDQEYVLNECTKWFLPKVKSEVKVEVKKEEDYGLLDDLEHTSQASTEEKQQLLQARQHDANILLVHGAFGCGKSYLLVSIIRFICTLLDQIGEEETKILVCALTNVAVDRILLMLLNSGFTDFARVGSLKKINRTLLPYTHCSATNKKQADKEALKEL